MEQGSIPPWPPGADVPWWARRRRGALREPHDYAYVGPTCPAADGFHLALYPGALVSRIVIIRDPGAVTEVGSPDRAPDDDLVEVRTFLGNWRIDAFEAAVEEKATGS